MKKFKFRLEKVMHFRDLVRDEKRRTLALRVKELNDEETKLGNLEKSQLGNALTSGGTVPAGEISLVFLYGTRLKEEIRIQHERIEAARKLVEEARAVYLEAEREFKALSTLRERKLKEYQEYVDREDGKFLDELSVQRSGRR